MRSGSPNWIAKLAFEYLRAMALRAFSRQTEIGCGPPREGPCAPIAIPYPLFEHGAPSRAISKPAPSPSDACTAPEMGTAGDFSP